MILFLLLQCIWIIKATVTEVDPQYILRLFEIDPLNAISIVHKEYRVVFKMIEEFGNFALFVSLIPPLIRYRNSKYIDTIIRWTYFLYVLAGFLSLIDYIGVAPSFFTPENSFWVGTKRFGGIFTDPNSLGITAALCLGLSLHYLERAKNKLDERLYIAFSCLWVFLGLVSGSRTFFLIVTLSFILFFWGAISQFKWSSLTKNRLPTLFGISGCIALLIITFLPFFVGIQRVFSIQDLSSRFIFFRVNEFLFLHHPLMGVGYHQFERFFSSAATSLGFQVGTWKDNPNSFYLGIFSELGLVGVLLFTIGLSAYHFKYQSTVLGVVGVSFLFALIFGCHLNFFEVALIAPVFIAEIISHIGKINLRIHILGYAVLILATLIVYKIPQNDHGYFERKNQKFVRREAVITIPCEHTTFIDAPLMNKGKEALQVFINEKVYTFTDSTQQELSHDECGSVKITCSRFFMANRPYCVRIR